VNVRLSGHVLEHWRILMCCLYNEHSINMLRCVHVRVRVHMCVCIHAYMMRVLAILGDCVCITRVLSYILAQMLSLSCCLLVQGFYCFSVREHNDIY